MLAHFDSHLWDSTLPLQEYRNTLKQKKILLINAGPRLKYLVLKRIRDLGIGTIVALDIENGWFADQLDGLVPCVDPISPLIDPENPEADPRVQGILAYMREKNITFDGVWTFADKSVVLCAQIAQFLGQRGIQPKILSKLKNKQTIREWLYENRETLGHDIPHVYAMPCIHYADAKEEDYPLIMKGVESVGKSLIHIINDASDLERYIAHYGAHTVTLEPYFEGTDVDLNVLVKDGKIVWSGFVENAVPLQPLFLENGSMTCQCLSTEEQQELMRYTQHILDLAQGIDTACLHVEFRIRHDEEGFAFTLIEINFRMGGSENFTFHLGQDNHDLILSSLELAFGLELSQLDVPQKSGKYPYIRTADLYSTKTGTLTAVYPPKNTNNILEYLFYAPMGMTCEFPPGPDDYLAWMVTGGNTPEEADAALQRALAETRVGIE